MRLTMTAKSAAPAMPAISMRRSMAGLPRRHQTTAPIADQQGEQVGERQPDREPDRDLPRRHRRRRDQQPGPLQAQGPDAQGQRQRDAAAEITCMWPSCSSRKGA